MILWEFISGGLLLSVPPRIWLTCYEEKGNALSGREVQDGRVVALIKKCRQSYAEPH